MSRKDAAATGQLTYFSSKPCKRGHLSQRYTSGGMCIQCVKDANDDRNRQIQEAKRQNIKMRVEGARIYQKLLLPSGEPLMNDLAEIINSRDIRVVEQCKEFLRLMKGQIRPLHERLVP